MQFRFLFGLAAGLLLTASATVRAQDNVKAIITKAIQAHGGEAALAKFSAEQARAKGSIFVDGKTIAFTAETSVQLPGQFKNVMQYEVQGKKGTLVQVLDGDKGWLSIDGDTKPLDGARLTETRETMYVHGAGRLLPLLKEAFQLTMLPETKVNGQPALGIKVASKGHKDINLYFDKAAGLLVKTERRTLNNAGKEVLQEEFFSDFKEINGVKRPMKITVVQDGNKFMEGEMTEIKQTDKLPPSTFAKP
jgi:hypothetical protein